jgi:hypothetical protein
MSSEKKREVDGWRLKYLQILALKTSITANLKMSSYIA